MRTEKNINNPWGLKGEELRKYRDAVEASEQSYASYSEPLNGVLYIPPNTNELLKLDMIIQLPYMIRSEARKEQAEERRKSLEEQLTSYGIAYIDATEKIIQLNRSLENNLCMVPTRTYED